MIKSEFKNTRTQDLPSMYIDAGQFYWGTKKLWKKESSVFIKKSNILLLPRAKSVDIDNKKDWREAEFYAKKNDPLINTLTSKLIFIGGVTRSGKSFLCPIVSTFKKTEMFIYNSVAENIYYLNFLKMISNKTAYYLFKHIYNEKIYNLNIGRDLNRRKFDYTSINNFRNSKIYLQKEKNLKWKVILK